MNKKISQTCKYVYINIERVYKYTQRRKITNFEQLPKTNSRSLQISLQWLGSTSLPFWCTVGRGLKPKIDNFFAMVINFQYTKTWSGLLARTWGNTILQMKIKPNTLSSSQHGENTQSCFVEWLSSPPLEHWQAKATPALAFYSY